MNMPMEKDMMDAKLSKLGELKDFIYDLLAEGASDEQIMEEVEQAISGDTEAEKPLEMESEESGGDEVSELRKMKEAYFKPKPASPRNGTGVFIAAMSQKQAPKKMDDIGGKPGKMGKMK